MPATETIKQKIEREVKEKLESMPTSLKYEHFMGCHWCAGIVTDTPTKGRLECRTCGAVSLVGRSQTAPIVHVEGRDGNLPTEEKEGT